MSDVSQSEPINDGVTESLNVPKEVDSETMLISPVKQEEKEAEGETTIVKGEEMDIAESKEDTETLLTTTTKQSPVKTEPISATEEEKPVYEVQSLTEQEIEFLSKPYIEFNDSKKRLRETDFIYKPNSSSSSVVIKSEKDKEKGEGEATDKETISGDEVVDDTPHYKKRLIYSTTLPSKPDYNIRWTERVASYYVPSASYTYEVQYSIPKHYPLGFTVQWQHIPYSHNSPHKCILVCVVKSVSDHFHTAIGVGDILLKMNDEVLVYKPGDTFDEKRLLQLLTPKGFNQLSNLTSFRFLRAGSTCNGCIPSVAEILLLLNEKHANAKYNVKTNMKDNQEYYGLELIQMDNQVKLTSFLSLFVIIYFDVSISVA